MTMPGERLLYGAAGEPQNTTVLMETIYKLKQEIQKSNAEKQALAEQLNCLILLVKRYIWLSLQMSLWEIKLVNRINIYIFILKKSVISYVTFFKRIYTVEIDTKEKLWDLFFDTSSVFNPERLTRKKTNSLRRFEMEMVYIFSQCGITRDTSHNFFKLTLSSRYFHVICNAKSSLTLYI